MIRCILRTLLPTILLTACAATPFAPPEGVIRVGTWNLEHFGGRKVEANWSPNGKRTIEDYAKIANYIHRIDVDVLAVQEIASPLALQQLCEDLGNSWDFVLGHSGDYPNYRISVGFLWNTSSVTLVQAEELAFPRKSGNLSIFSRLPVSAVFRTVDGNLDFRMLTVHLKASRNEKSSNKRKAETSHLLVYVRGLATDPNEDLDIIVCGDFNHTYGAPAHQVFTVDQYVRYLESENAPATIIHFPEPIDHFAVTEGLDAELVPGSRRVHGKLASADKDAWRKTYSDHIPVTIDLRAGQDHDPDASFAPVTGTRLRPQRVTVGRDIPVKAPVAAPVRIDDDKPFPIGATVDLRTENAGYRGTLIRPLGAERNAG